MHAPEPLTGDVVDVLLQVLLVFGHVGLELGLQSELVTAFGADHRLRK